MLGISHEREMSSVMNTPDLSEVSLTPAKRLKPSPNSRTIDPFSRAALMPVGAVSEPVGQIPEKRG